MTSDIFSDHSAMRAALGEGADTIDALMREISQGGDGTGLDADTFDKLNERKSLTAGELESAIADALVGRKAVDSFEEIDDNSSRSVDEGGGAFAGTDREVPSLGDSPLSGYGEAGPGGVSTNLSSAEPDTGFAAKQAAAQAQAQQAQMENAQMQAQMQQARESAAWQRAMADQQNQAMLNQMNIAAQQQAMVQAAEMQERLNEQAAAQQAALAEGGGAEPSGGDVELSSEEIQTLIRELFEEEGNLVEGGDYGYEEMGYEGSYDPSGPSGLSPDEVSFDKVTDGELSDAEVDAIIDQAADLNGIPNDPEIRQIWKNVMGQMSIHESGNNPNAANGWDSNAHGATQHDGFPFNSSRGIWQTIPTTFAAHHIEGTSNSIYDPLASGAAAMHYMMERYNISPEGAGLAEFAATRGIDVSTGESYGGYIGY